MKDRVISIIYIVYTSFLLFVQLICYWFYYWYKELNHPITFQGFDYGFAILAAIVSGVVIIPLILLSDFISSFRNKNQTFHYWKALNLICVFIVVLLLQDTVMGGYIVEMWLD